MHGARQSPRIAIGGLVISFVDFLKDLRRRLGFGLDVLAADGFGHQTIADCLGADFEPHDSAIDDRSHFLDIRLELAGGDARDFGPHAAEVFGLAAVGHLVAEAGLFSGKMANAWHTNLSFPALQGGEVYGIRRAIASL